MKVRFLQLTESQVPGFPFVPGQIIEIDDLDRDVRRWLKYNHAEVVREEPETAVVTPAERAVAPVVHAAASVFVAPEPVKPAIKPVQVGKKGKK